VKLAAEAGEWDVVTTLSRQLEAMRRSAEGSLLRVVKDDRSERERRGR
jgi:hypothetical protein